MGRFWRCGVAVGVGRVWWSTGIPSVANLEDVGTDGLGTWKCFARKVNSRQGAVCRNNSCKAFSRNFQTVLELW